MVAPLIGERLCGDAAIADPALFLAPFITSPQRLPPFGETPVRRASAGSAAVFFPAFRCASLAAAALDRAPLGFAAVRAVLPDNNREHG